MTDQITPEAAEAYVRARVEGVTLVGSGGLYWISGDEFSLCTRTYLTPAEAWLAAYQFTVAHEEEVRRLTYCISLLKLIREQGDLSSTEMPDHERDREALTETIQREQAARAELTRGWKEPK